MSLPSQRGINGFIMGSGGLTLEFRVRQKMQNGSSGAGAFDSNNIHGSRQLLRAYLKGLHFCKRNEVFFLYAAENAESETVGNTASSSVIICKRQGEK